MSLKRAFNYNHYKATRPSKIKKSDIYDLLDDDKKLYIALKDKIKSDKKREKEDREFFKNLGWK